MEKIKASITVFIKDADIDDIMVTALEGGINYWCDKVIITAKPEEKYQYASDVISKGGTLKLIEIEEEDSQYLDKEKLLKGIEQYIEDEDNPYNILTEGANNRYTIDTTMVDADVADSIIQYAVFGELVYG